MTDPNQPTLTVVGLVYFELAVPAGMLPVPAGRERFVEHMRVGLGGALNTASVARALGQSVVLAYPSGHGLTDRAASSVLRDLGLPSLTWDARADTAISLVLDGDGDRSFLSFADFDALEACPQLPPSACIHVAGLKEARLLAHRLQDARSQGSLISVSGGWAPEELETLADEPRPWDFLFLNEVEAEHAVGSAQEAPERLARTAANVVVTRGSKGALGRVGGEWFEVPARPVDTIDATGAGDAFVAGFLSAHLKGRTAAASAALATEVAARQLGMPGGVAVDASRYSDLRVTS